jgi:hypothetical protein
MTKFLDFLAGLIVGLTFFGLFCLIVAITNGFVLIFFLATALILWAIDRMLIRFGIW